MQKYILYKILQFSCALLHQADHVIIKSCIISPLTYILNDFTVIEYRNRTEKQSNADNMNNIKLCKLFVDVLCACVSFVDYFKTRKYLLREHRN